MQEPTIPIVYILSSGRSGSTLLDLLLGSHPNIWTLGEAQLLPWVIKANTRCGCGTPISTCGFWQALIPRLSLERTPYPIEYFRTNRGQGRTIHWPLLPGLLCGAVAKRQQQAIDRYGRINASYFNAVLHAASERRGAPTNWLVDASKDVYRLHWLQKSGLFDLRVIHLIKHPSAFVYSMIKSDLPHARRKAIRMTGRWIVEKILAQRLCTSAFAREKSILLRYEQLASRPEETMIRVGKWLGVAFSPDLIRGFRNYQNHALSGNQMRWQDSAIRLDEQWRTVLPPSYIQAIRFATWPVRASAIDTD